MPALSRQFFYQSEAGRGVARRLSQDLAVDRDGLVGETKLPQAAPEGADGGADMTPLGIEAGRLPVPGDGLFAPTLRLERVTEVVVGRGVAGLQADRPP